MKDNLISIPTKARQLKRHKFIATSFFVVMLVIYICMIWILRIHALGWAGYVKAFCEAAMVGALADWFAVTALFHHPLGLKIPHTNLIEKKKNDIGDNLGNFVVENFLTPQTLRPYIDKIKVASQVANWMENKKNRSIILTEISKILLDILEKTNDETVANFIADKGTDLLQKMDMGLLLGNTLSYLVQQNEHEKLLSFLLEKIKVFIAANEAVVKERVKKESGIFVPGFVDTMLANRITVGLANYLHEIQQDKNHNIRKEITAHLNTLAEQLKKGDHWKEDLGTLRDTLLSKQSLQQYASGIWTNVKSIFQNELTNEGSVFFHYMDSNILAFADKLKTDTEMQHKIDSWVRFTAYRLALQHTENVGSLISNTVGNWKGKDLSQKLELEVGKDLQFIRINGTIVGGLVGLLIYTITQFL